MKERYNLLVDEIKVILKLFVLMSLKVKDRSCRINNEVYFTISCALD